ncbi:MAG: LuxR family transcriptional regulator, partial [Methyloceanibacter sp.]
MFIDSHCHLDFPDLATKREAVLAHAEGAGVGLM